MDEAGVSHITKIDWPAPEPAWQKALHAVEKKTSFGGECGQIGKAFLRTQSIVLSARATAFDAVLEPNKNSFLAVFDPTIPRDG